MAAVSTIAGAKGKGKKPKIFLESQDTLDLAVSIGELQESKSKSRSDRRHTQLVRPESTRTEKKSKSRIKEKKAILAAERSKHKKEKAKSRRQIASHTGTGHKTNDDQKERPSTDRSAPRKRVSFA